MGRNTDDGFIIESRAKGADPYARCAVLTFIALASDEAEALSIVEADYPEQQHRIVESGPDVRAQAARLRIEPGTYRQT